MRSSSIGTGVAVAAAIVAAAASITCRNNSNDDSVVVVELMADPPGASSITTVEIRVQSPTVGQADVDRTFHVQGGLSATSATKLGVFVPPEWSGDLPVVVTSGPVGDNACNGYTGMGSAHLTGSKTTTPPVQIQLHMGSICPSDGGGTGGSGSGGMPGGAGTGGVNGGGTGGTGTGGMNGTGTGGTGTGGAQLGTGGGPGSGGRGTGGAGGSGTGTGGAGGMQSSGPPDLTKCTEYAHSDTNPCPDPTMPQFYRLRSLAFTPDGTLFASAAEDGTIRIWNVSNGRTLTNAGHDLTVTAMQLQVTFTPDGKNLIGGARGHIAVWDTTTWNRTAYVTVDGDVVQIGVTSDGRFLVSVAEGLTTDHVYVHDLMAINNVPMMVDLPTSTYGWDLTLPPVQAGRNRLVYVASHDNGIYPFNLDATLTLPTPIPVVQSGRGLVDTDITHDGTSLAVADDAGLTSFFNLPLGAGATPRGTLMLDPDTTHVVYSPSARQLVSSIEPLSDYPMVEMHDIATGGLLSQHMMQSAPQAIVFSPSGSAVAFGELACGRITVCTN